MSEKSSSVDGCGQEQEETIYNQDETGAEVDSITYFITEAWYLVTACRKISTATVIKIWPQQYYETQYAIWRVLKVSFLFKFYNREGGT